MAWQATVWVLPSVLAGVVTGLLFLYTYRHRQTRIAVPLLGVLLTCSIWAWSDAIRLLATDRGTKVLADNVSYVGASFIALSIFVVSLEYTNRRAWLTRRRLVALLVVPVATIILAFTNHVHSLLRSAVTVREAAFPLTGETVRYLSFEFGPAFYLVVLFSYPLVAMSGLLFLGRYLDSDEPGRYRNQALVLFGSHLPPFFINLLYLFGIIPRDFTVVGFATTGVMITAAIYRYDLLDIAPIVRSTVVENMDGGVIVIDSEDTVADLNPRAVEVLDVSASDAIGRDVETVFASFPTLLERFGDEYDTREQVTLEEDDWVRHVDVDITTLRDADRIIGRVAVFRDVTEQERIRRELEQRRAELERQNERLEDFARIVTHDLRNPLTVAKGRLDLIREETASEHVDRTAEALDRMEALVEDVRTMAAQGQAVRETETVSLRTTAKEAWRSVATADATLDVTTNATIDASRSGLLQLYENLFRNAIEHGRTDVRVTVGDLDDGFFVADDGPGIPEDERDEVMEDGYTTTTDGTGLGLPIVRTIADAHGWTVDVTESTDGGARFEIRSIEDVSGTDRPTDSAADGQAPGV